MITYRNRNNKIVRLGGELGGGGEGKVYEVTGNTTQVAKVWTPVNSSSAAMLMADEMSEKIKIMIRNPPMSPNRNGSLFSKSHNPFAWPEDILYYADGKVAGYLMPRIDLTAFRDIFRYYVPRERRELEQQRGEAFNRQDFLLVARNLSEAFDCIHQAGYVVGDVNEKNALVSGQRQVVIIDCDSMQVKNPATDKTYLCTVGRPDYTPPGLTPGRERTPNDDCFGLAVIIFKLLMEGDHPYKISHTKTETKDKIRLGQFPYRHPGNRRRITDAMSRYRDRWENMEPNLRRCFRDAFAPDYRSQRTSAAEWVDELDRIINPRATGNSREMGRRIQEMDRQLQDANREREDAVKKLDNERNARNLAGQAVQEKDKQLKNAIHERAETGRQLKLAQDARASAESQLANTRKELSSAKQALQEKDRQLVDVSGKRAEAERQLKLAQDEKQAASADAKRRGWGIVFRGFCAVAGAGVIVMIVLLLLILQP